MKVAILSESSADEAALRIVVDTVLGTQTKPVDLSLRTRGWPAVRNVLPAVLRGLHYGSDAEGLVVIVDSDDSSLGPATRDTAEARRNAVRLAALDELVAREQAVLRPVPNRAALRCAVGLAIPAIEAWYLCGEASEVGEAQWRQFIESSPAAGQARQHKLEMKKRVYGTDRPSLALEKRRAVECARRLAQRIDVLCEWFPVGFGTLREALEQW